MKTKEKSQSKTPYKDTPEGKFICKQVKKIRIEGILCISLGVIYLLLNILNKESWYMYVITGGLFVFGSYFIYKSRTIRKNKEKIYNYKNQIEE